MPLISRVPLALAAACALATAGCGGPAAARVTGRVTYKNGAPLADASVIARCDDTGKSSVGTTDADGRYELSTVTTGDGVPPGTYMATILEKKANRDAITRPTIAAKYGNPSQSGLTFKVAAGESKAFDVTVDPP